MNKFLSSNPVFTGVCIHPKLLFVRSQENLDQLGLLYSHTGMQEKARGWGEEQLPPKGPWALCIKTRLATIACPSNAHARSSHVYQTWIGSRLMSLSHQEMNHAGLVVLLLACPFTFPSSKIFYTYIRVPLNPNKLLKDVSGGVMDRPNSEIHRGCCAGLYTKCIVMHFLLTLNHSSFAPSLLTFCSLELRSQLSVLAAVMSWILISKQNQRYCRMSWCFKLE